MPARNPLSDEASYAADELTDADLDVVVGGLATETGAIPGEKEVSPLAGHARPAISGRLKTGHFR